jgi:hypothetical protein
LCGPGELICGDLGLGEVMDAAWTVASIRHLCCPGDLICGDLGLGEVMDDATVKEIRIDAKPH